MMHDILILSEGAVPDHLAGSGRWPGLRISVLAGLTHRDVSHRLRAVEKPDAVIVTTNAPNTALTDALAGLACPSVEVQADNPNRNSDGSANLSAEPAGADALVYGLGEAGYETALTLLATQLGEPAR